MRQGAAPVISNHQVMSGVHLIWLECPQITPTAQPGQFVMVRCGEDTLLRRPFSIHRADREKGRLALLFQVVGRGTDWLAQRCPGDIISVLGPLGNGFTIQSTTKNILLVAGGIGLAPLAFLAEVARQENANIELLFGGATQERLLPVEMLFPSIWIAYDSIIKATEDGSVGKRGLVTDMLKFYAGDSKSQIFACGPLPMYKTMAQMPELKDRQVQVSLEVRMGCGLGVCYGCTVKTKSGLRQVCTDGPVFELDDILWDELSI